MMVGGTHIPEELEFQLWKWSEDVAWRMMELNTQIAIERLGRGNEIDQIDELFTDEKKLARQGAPIKRLGIVLLL